MPSIHEHLSERFAAFEQRGRGWSVFPAPVVPEPPFQPFAGYCLPPVADDGRVPTKLSSLVSGLSRWLGDAPDAVAAAPEEETEPEPQYIERGALVELQTALPAKLDIKRDAFGSFLDRLAVCTEPVTFELLGTAENIVAQFVAAQSDTPFVRRQLSAFFPDVTFLPVADTLANAWTMAPPDSLVVEFGLEREFLLPLSVGGNHDPFLSLISALSDLEAEECAVFQVMFQPVQHDWRGNMWRAITDAEGKALFSNAPKLIIGAKEKFATTLYGVVVRLAVKADGFERTISIAREMAFALRFFGNPEGNVLIPLHNDDYPSDAHEEDVYLRQSRRSGMLLNTEELTGFVHFPGSEVRSAKLRRAVKRTKAAPSSVTANGTYLLGENRYQGKSVPVGLTADQRVSHLHLIGASGTGKSTLLFNLIRQDIDHGRGIAVFDPHGDLVDKVLGIIPPERICDVVLLDPSDEEYSVGFNILSAHSDSEKNLLASDLVSVFQRLSTSWGDQMGSVLQNAILAFLENSQGGTLADVQRFLIDSTYRNHFLKTVRDPNVLFYWQKAFPQLGSNKSIGPVLTRLEKLLSMKPIRYMVSQAKNRLDFADIMDSGKIFIAKLPQGKIGKENSYLLGSLLLSKFQQLAMDRQRMAAANRRDYFIYLDEAHNFMTPSMAEILTGTRKYRVGLIFAHHDLQQLERDRDVAAAVMSSSYTRVVFRVSDADAKKLSEGFETFEAQDLQKLGTGEAIVRVAQRDGDFNLHIPKAMEADEAEAAIIREQVVASSRAKYATARSEIEAALRPPVEEVEEPPTVSPKAKAKPPAPEPPAPPPPPPVTPTEPIPTPPVTSSEKETVVPVEAKPPKPSRDAGKGGGQHQAIQKRIKEAAEALGFLSVIEKQLAGGQESVDLMLERGEQRIACEISITTTIDHEFKNVQKCKKAGVTQIAVICLDKERLRKIEAAVVGGLGANDAAGVTYHLPDAFIAYLKSLPLPTPKESVTTRQGYKVKRSASKLTAEEQRQRQDMANRILAETLKRKKG